LIEEKEYEGHLKMHEKPPWIDSPHQVISNGRWHTTWFLMVEEIFPLKDDHVKFSPKWLRSYKLAPKSSKGEKWLQTRSYRSALKTSKGGTWKDINTHQDLSFFIKKTCDLLVQVK
jgi:hypothetical protein